MGLFGRFFHRETAAERHEWLDQAVAQIGQRAMAQRLAQAREAARGFEAAETPAWTESWPTHGSPINDDLARQLPILRARARGLGRDNEWATNYQIKLDDNVLGAQGIVLQMRLKNRNGEAQTKINDRIEAAWAEWCKQADVSGLDFRSVESLVLAALATDGEVLYRIRRGCGPFGIQIQLLPADLLDVNLRREYGGNRVRMGVEINKDGLPIAYWLLAAKAGDMPPEYTVVGKHLRVPAKDIRHRFLTREIWQQRGYPWLTAGARRLWLLHDFEEAAAVASSNAAKRQGFFVSPDGDAPPGFADTIVSGVLEAAKASGKTLTSEEVRDLTAAAEKYATTMPGQYDTLPTGYDFRPFESKWPNVSAEGYVKQQLRGWAAARGMSYVTLGNDLEAVNYSSARVGIGDEREHYKTLQSKLTGWLHSEIFPFVLPELVVRTPGLLVHQLGNYLAAATWQPRRWSGIDPQKEAGANDINLRNKLTSRRRLILERGEDPDEIFAEIAAEERLLGPQAPAADPANPQDPDDDSEDAAGPDKENSDADDSDND